MTFTIRSVFLLVSFAIFFNAKITSGYLITLDAHQEECFYERLSQGTKVKFLFEVLDGGSLDIELTIKDPANSIIHFERGTSGRYSIEANQAGQHTYCFGNKQTSSATKIILFSIEHTEKKSDSSSEHDKLGDMVTELSGLMTGVKHEMDFLAARDRMHRVLSEKVNSRLIMWSLFELCLLGILAFAQTFYIKRSFATTMPS